MGNRSLDCRNAVAYDTSAVSYTHLDVYKRQRQHQNIIFYAVDKQPVRENVTFPMACPIAVSYTHLDVYKRQLWRCEMDYMTLKEAAEKWGVTPRRVNYYCCLLYTSRCV